MLVLLNAIMILGGSIRDQYLTAKGAKETLRNAKKRKGYGAENINWDLY
jgi:hypothetical protein